MNKKFNVGLQSRLDVAWERIGELIRSGEVTQKVAQRDEVGKILKENLTVGRIEWEDPMWILGILKGKEKDKKRSVLKW